MIFKEIFYSEIYFIIILNLQLLEKLINY